MLAIEGDHILSLIVGFLKRYGEEELAESVSDKIVDVKALKNVPLCKKKLEKIIQNYVLQDEKLVAYYESFNQQSEQEQEQLKTQSKKRKRSASHSLEMKQELNVKSEKRVKESEPKTGGIYSKFTQARLLETTVEKGEKVEEEESQKKRQMKEVKSEKVKVEKKPKKKDTSQSESQEQEVKPKGKAQPKVVAPKTRKTSKQVSKKAEESEQQEEQQKPVVKAKQPLQIPSYNNNNNNQNADYAPRQKKFFSRIDPSKIAPLPENLRDNTYQAKLKFGDGGDDWGKYGNEKLKNERGDGFKKMKGKLKNKAFQGGTIDPFRVNSISLL